MKKTMININEAKARLSEYARRVQKGETIILCNRNKPFAEIRPIEPPKEVVSRPFGLAKGRLHLRDDFNRPDRRSRRCSQVSEVAPGYLCADLFFRRKFANQRGAEGTIGRLCE